MTKEEAGEKAQEIVKQMIDDHHNKDVLPSYKSMELLANTIYQRDKRIENDTELLNIANGMVQGMKLIIQIIQS